MNRLYINRDWSTLKKLLAMKAAAGGSVPQTETATGSLVTFDTTKALPLIECVAGIEPVQEGSGDPSPENVRPISGWTGANVQRTGKNLCPRNTIRTSHNGIDYTVTDVGIRVHGTATSASYSWTGGMDYASTWLKLPAGTYTFSVTDMFGTNQSEGYMVFMGWDVDGVAISNFTLHNRSKTSTRTFSKDVGLYYGIFVKNGLTVDTVVKIQAELGSATAYEPYQGETYDITFPSEAGTVYGGTLDVTNGVLTVDRAMIASYNGETLPGEWISDRDVYAAGTTPSIGAQVVYELAAPITYQLTPQEITTLIGTNNVWADTGDITVKYYK